MVTNLTHLAQGSELLGFAHLELMEIKKVSEGSQWSTLTAVECRLQTIEASELPSKQLNALMPRWELNPIRAIHRHLSSHSESEASDGDCLPSSLGRWRDWQRNCRSENSDVSVEKTCSGSAVESTRASHWPLGR